MRQFAEENGLGLGKVAQPLRAALTGRSVSPPVFDVLAIFGREECLARLARCVAMTTRIRDGKFMRLKFAPMGYND